MGDTCEICKKNPAKISIGNHSYCFDCHNKMAFHDMEIDDSLTYAKNMSVIEPNGQMHTFEIEHVVLGEIVSWEANEKDGDYQFRLISDVGEDGTATAQKLFRKIVEGVCNKTLEEHKGQWNTSYSLKSKGNITIIEDEDRDFAPAFEIDGKKFIPEEFAELVSGYAGFQMQYQMYAMMKIDDAGYYSLVELGNSVYLFPFEFKISKESIMMDKRFSMNTFGGELSVALAE